MAVERAVARPQGRQTVFEGERSAR